MQKIIGKADAEVRVLEADNEVTLTGLSNRIATICNSTSIRDIEALPREFQDELQVLQQSTQDQIESTRDDHFLIKAWVIASAAGEDRVKTLHLAAQSFHFSQSTKES